MIAVWTFLKSAKGIATVVAVVVLATLIITSVNSCKKSEDEENANYVNQGATIERSRANDEVIKDIEDAQDAVRNVTPAERERVCAKYDRNCQNN